jgi:hypothetical protein
VYTFQTCLVFLKSRYYLRILAWKPSDGGFYFVHLTRSISRYQRIKVALRSMNVTTLTWLHEVGGPQVLPTWANFPPLPCDRCYDLLELQSDLEMQWLKAEAGVCRHRLRCAQSAQQTDPSHGNQRRVRVPRRCYSKHHLFFLAIFRHVRS